jgi:uncharacterized protein YcbK (DUF882 family)
MITFKEMIGDVSIADIPILHQQNIQELLKKVNVIRDEWAKPMTVTSGYRTLQDHLRIYSQKGITDRAHIPMKSQHLIGAAVDIYDPDLSLTKWLKENDSQRLKDAGLYCEDGNPNWVHFQLFPPKSMRRWFLP